MTAESGTEPSPLTLVEQGWVARADAVAEVREEHGDPHSGPGGRAYRVTMAGGVSVEVLPERGLDLGSLWFDNQPVAWRSALGPRGAHADPGGEGWLGSFTGGALVTCGLENIGPPRDGHGLHGSHHLTAATDVAVVRAANGDVEVSGTVDSSHVFGRRVTLHRVIRVLLGEPVVEVIDTIVNHGPQPAAVPVLYHVNLGAPTVLAGTRTVVDAADHIPRDAAAESVPWEVFPAPVDATMESVWEHRGLRADERGRARATVTSPAGRRVTVTWDGNALPRCVQWIYPQKGGCALGIEPTNAPLFGADRRGPHAGAPVLGPGERLRTGVTLRVS